MNDLSYSESITARCRLLLAAWSLMFVAIASTRADEPMMTITRDITYAKLADGTQLKLDLYRSEKYEGPRLLIVWMHGGAWRAGSKNDMPLGKIVAQGFHVASVDYRLTPIAPFPALIHDLKASIRYLRAHAKELDIDSSRVIAAGSSAGGHLAALVGVTNGHVELEGKVGEHLDQSSDVQGIMSLYGASNLRSILSQSTPHGLSVRIPALKLLLNGPLEEREELAKLASPVEHLDRNDPPLLLIHGDADPQMPIEQSRELSAAYEKLGLSVKFETIAGGKHGGPEFYDSERTRLMLAFLSQ